MPRKRVVSRTILTTSARCLMINLKTEEPFKETFVINGSFTRDEINRKGERLFNGPGKKFVRCVKVTHNSDLYIMPEADFIKLAKKSKKEKEN